MAASTGRAEATDQPQRPLAPATWPMLVGVFALVELLMYAASTQFSNDWVSVFACIAVLAGAAVLLNRNGRARAEAHPHPLYRADRLPNEKSVVKNVVVILVLLGLVFYAIQTSTPDDFGSAFPYFSALAFLYIVLPQLMARKILRQYDQSHRSAK